jgi:hypothetical protein
MGHAQIGMRHYFMDQVNHPVTTGHNDAAMQHGPMSLPDHSPSPRPFRPKLTQPANIASN